MPEPKDELDEQIQKLHDQGHTDAEMSKQLGRPARTIGYRVKRMGLTSNTLRNTRSADVVRPTEASTHSVQDLDIDRISSDAATQMRVRLSMQTIDEYAEAMEQGEAFPPIVVFQEDETYWTADGWHRVEAAKQLGLDTIRGEVRPGGLDDAIDYACGANTRHGLRPTIEDRRKAAMTQLRRHPERSDREIARMCGCSHSTVGLYREELEAATSPASGRSTTPAAKISDDKMPDHSPASGRSTTPAAKISDDKMPDHSPASGRSTTHTANPDPSIPNEWPPRIDFDEMDPEALEAERKAAAMERLKREWAEIDEREGQRQTPSEPSDPEREKEEAAIQRVAESLNDYLRREENTDLFWKVLAGYWRGMVEYYEVNDIVPQPIGEHAFESLPELFPEPYRSQLTQDTPDA